MHTIFFKIILSILLLATFISATQIILVRHKNRLLLNELQQLQRQRDDLIIEWGKLQLEQSTWAQPSRIESVAREQLHMVLPEIDDIKTVKP
jgi:cell division protein FtsL